MVKQMSLQVINQRTLKQLVEDGIVRSATAIPHEDKWEVVVHYGRVEKVLATTPGNKIRTWSKMDTLVEYIAKLGIKRLETDLTGYTVGIKPGRKRPDRSIALKQAHAAAEHDKWFREQVQIGLEQAKSPNAVWISQEDMEKRMDAKVENLKARSNA